MMNIRKTMMMSVLALALLQPVSSFADNPYEEGAPIKVDTTRVQANLEKGAENAGAAVEKAGREITKGLDKAGKAIDSFSKDLDKIFSDLNKSTEPSIVIQENPNGTTSAQQPVVTVSNSAPVASAVDSKTTAEVKNAAGNFWDSLKNLFTSGVRWGKAAWKEVTGPSQEESFVTSTINKVHTKFEQGRMKASWSNFLSTTGKMIKSVGNFFQNLFK